MRCEFNSTIIVGCSLAIIIAISFSTFLILDESPTKDSCKDKVSMMSVSTFLILDESPTKDSCKDKVSMMSVDRLEGIGDGEEKIIEWICDDGIIVEDYRWGNIEGHVWFTGNGDCAIKRRMCK